MFDEEMTGAHLVWLVRSSTGRIGGVEVLGTGKRANRLFSVTLRDLPCRLLGDGIVEVGQTARVAKSDFPLRLLAAKRRVVRSEYIDTACRVGAAFEHCDTYRHLDVGFVLQVAMMGDKGWCRCAARVEKGWSGKIYELGTIASAVEDEELDRAHSNPSRECQTSA